MEQISVISQIQARVQKARQEGKVISLVPTMGYFHEGHLSLMRYARKHSDLVLVSLFVNPTQFGPGEDFEAYPRDLERDKKLAQEQDVDILFTPGKEEMYLLNHLTYVRVDKLDKFLCGRSRPTHFQGVCTVVLKLFNICQPDFAVFGQKDWQQLIIIKKMVEDLNVGVKVVGHPIVREPDGLAMSSRNVYLSKEERKQAANIYQGLLLAKKLVEQGEVETSRIKERVQNFYQEQILLGKLDYLEIVHPFELTSLERIEDKALMAVAMQVGKARLIDNLLLRGSLDV